MPQIPYIPPGNNPGVMAQSFLGGAQVGNARAGRISQAGLQEQAQRNQMALAQQQMAEQQASRMQQAEQFMMKLKESRDMAEINRDATEKLMLLKQEMEIASPQGRMGEVRADALETVMKGLQSGKNITDIPEAGVLPELQRYTTEGGLSQIGRMLSGKDEHFNLTRKFAQAQGRYMSMRDDPSIPNSDKSKALSEMSGLKAELDHVEQAMRKARGETEDDVLTIRGRRGHDIRIKTPQDVKKAMDAGDLTYDEAAQILTSRFFTEQRQ